MHYMLDTSICIYLIKRAPEVVYEKFQRLSVGDVVVSAITFCELQFGVAKNNHPEKNQSALTEFLGPLEVLDFPIGASPLYGRIRAELQKAGTPIGNYDLLIASHALYAGLTLVTHNTKEFERVSDLKIENWVE